MTYSPDADLKVIQLIKQYSTIFLPDTICKYQYKPSSDKRFPNTAHFAGVIMLRTLGIGLGSAVMSLDEFVAFRPKTILKYLRHMAVEEKSILWEPTDHYNQFKIGFNPEKFGPLFPKYEDALKIVKGENK